MIAIVRGVDDVCIVELAAGLKTRNQRVNKLVHALQGTQPLAVEMIVVIDGLLVLFGQCLDPVGSTWLELLTMDNSGCTCISHLVWIEMLRARDLHIPEQSLVAIQRDGFGHYWRTFSIESAHIDIGMRRDRSDSEKEGPVAIKAIL